METNTLCGHQCSGNCRRVGCECSCGEFHSPSGKKIVFIECEGCGGSFSENLIHHYENPFTHWEADLCDPCASKMEAENYEVSQDWSV